MADNTSKNTPEGTPAGDDYGIRNDQILDLCDYIVRKLWERIFLDMANRPGDRQQELSLTELHQMADTLATTWALTSDILEIDAKLKWLLDQDEDEDESDDEESDEDEDDEGEDDDDEDNLVG